VRVEFYTHLPAYEEGTECSETSAYKIQTPGESPKRKHTTYVFLPPKSVRLSSVLTLSLAFTHSFFYDKDHLIKHRYAEQRPRNGFKATDCRTYV